MGFGKKRGRKEVTLGYTLGVYNLYALIIPAGFEHAVTQLKTNFDEFVNTVSKAVVGCAAPQSPPPGGGWIFAKQKDG